MPVWAVIAIVVGVALLLAAVVAAGWFGWRAYERSTLLRLVVSTEAIEAAAEGLIETITRLAHVEDEELQMFADDADSNERRALAEVHSRASILRDELDFMPLPKSLVPVAEAMADAAYLVAREAGRVTDEDTGDLALERLAEVDLESVRGYTAQARRQLVSACSACGLEETAVYGGGLYL